MTGSPAKPKPPSVWKREKSLPITIPQGPPSSQPQRKRGWLLGDLRALRPASLKSLIWCPFDTGKPSNSRDLPGSCACCCCVSFPCFSPRRAIKQQELQPRWSARLPDFSGCLLASVQLFGLKEGVRSKVTLQALSGRVGQPASSQHPNPAISLSWHTVGAKTVKVFW